MVEVVRREWDSTLGRAGISKKDCDTIASALVYEGFFYDLDGQPDGETN